MKQTEPPLQELDLSIPDMHTREDESAAAGVLRDVPGIGATRFVSRGALVHYRADVISAEQICDLLRHAGFRATTFQDSATGRTGLSSA